MLDTHSVPYNYEFIYFVENKSTSHCRDLNGFVLGTAENIVIYVKYEMFLTVKAIINIEDDTIMFIYN